MLVNSSRYTTPSSDPYADPGIFLCGRLRVERNENSRKGVKAILKLGKDSRVEIGGDQVRIFGEVMVKGSVLETKSLANSGLDSPKKTNL
uniref:Uncharacterized protein n=1 Tax=Siphoviridae sp. ctQU013 TaxID=2826329 RepID=A0A8S5NMR3_9CAUD|nr:MAG TPA: hypothetical protein [Siphoviridae sp. ctQU013]